MPKDLSHSPQKLATLMELVRLKASHSFAEVSSSRLSAGLGISQQAASQRLIDLEKSGLIERFHSGRGLSVRLTEAGLLALRSHYDDLKGLFEDRKSEDQYEFRGRVFTGLREGAYYVSLRGYSRHFLDAFGFKPFPGTLNLRLAGPTMVEQRRRLGYLAGIEIPGFQDQKRTYGPVKCFRAHVGGRYPGAVLAIERTHYDNSVLEVISPLNLRKALKLKDGDECSVTAFLR
jgi:riboflavin kinase